MTKLQRGLYEQLVTNALEAQLEALDAKHQAVRAQLHGEEAADRIALHLGTLVRRVVAGLDGKQRTEVGLELARQIVGLLNAVGKGADMTDAPSPAGDMLQAIASLRLDGTPEHLPLPATPLLDTTLLTNAPGEPRIGFQLQSEIPSADRIDILMAFVRRSGIQPLLDLLRRHKDATRPLRLLTTTYTNSTELSALQALRDLGADIRVSYDTTSTRLQRRGYSTARRATRRLTSVPPT